MKARLVYGMLGILAVVVMACKKDISPTLTVTVVDTLGTKLANARVFSHPCIDQVSCDTSKININFIKEDLTDGNGQVVWEYPYSAIIDVFGQYSPCDTAAGEYCLMSGKTVARFESKRSRTNEENNFNVRLVLREERIP